MSLSGVKGKRWVRAVVKCKACGAPFDGWERRKSGRPRMVHCPAHRSDKARALLRTARCRDCKETFTLKPGEAKSYYGRAARCPGCLAVARGEKPEVRIEWRNAKSPAGETAPPTGETTISAELQEGASPPSRSSVPRRGGEET